MSRAGTGRIHLSVICDDAGNYVDNQTSRLYRFLRQNTGRAYTGVQLDVEFFSQHRARNTSTRKSEINWQVDPRIEWIDHWEDRTNPRDPLADKVHLYRHRFTQGCLPADSVDRCAEILEGRGEPVRCAGMPTRYGPGQRAPKRIAERVGPPALAATAQARHAWDPADDGQLFDSRPLKV